MVLLLVVHNAINIHDSKHGNVACETNILHDDGLVDVGPGIELAHLTVGSFIKEHQLHL